MSPRLILAATIAGLAALCAACSSHPAATATTPPAVTTAAAAAAEQLTPISSKWAAKFSAITAASPGVCDMSTAGTEPCGIYVGQLVQVALEMEDQLDATKFPQTVHYVGIMIDTGQKYDNALCSGRAALGGDVTECYDYATAVGLDSTTVTTELAAEELPG